MTLFAEILFKCRTVYCCSLAFYLTLLHYLPFPAFLLSFLPQHKPTRPLPNLSLPDYHSPCHLANQPTKASLFLSLHGSPVTEDGCLHPPPNQSTKVFNIFFQASNLFLPLLFLCKECLRWISWMKRLLSLKTTSTRSNSSADKCQQSSTSSTRCHCHSFYESPKE